MDGNRKTASLNSGSKKSKPRRNKIGALDNDSTGLINEGNSMEMDSMDDEQKNNRKNAASRLKKALAKNVRSKNPILFISNIMQRTQRWKNYATSRRQIQASGPDDGNDRRRTGGEGLTYEIDHDSKVKDHVDGTGSAKVDKEMTSIHNRNLIEYFARLGQAKNADECVSIDYIISLLDNGANINCTDKYKQTVLHEAARAWNVDVARFLVECGANIDQGDYRGRTALHIASAVDYPEMINFLIEVGANKEAITDGELQTPVHFAARNDARNSLKALIKNGCEYKEVRDYKGRTPLHVAAELDRSETARMLLELDDPAPAGVKDYSGQAAIVWMITKMPPVAKIALNQFHTTDRANRKQFYWLTWLEPRKEDDECLDGAHPQTAMQVLIAYRQYDLVTHTAFKRLIDVKWRKFGKIRAIFQTITNFLFILLWTAQGVFIDYEEKHKYVLPEQWWRIFLFLLALLMAGYQIKEELSEYFFSRKAHAQWRDWREKEVKRDLEYAHDRWPEEKNYLDQEIDQLDKIRPQYFNDFWNIFDWICYALLLVCIITHLVDIFQHTNFVARLHVRLMSVTIILIWLRLLKNARAFATLGPFIVIVGHMIRDCFKFCFLYLTFLFPYACAFWMLFGGQKIPEKYQGQPWASNYTVTVNGMTQPNSVFFSLFRLTLVDEYAYDDMKAVDDIMTDLLIGTWLALSAVVMLNLFIALMSDTFQRVFDNASANAVMQKAITILSIEEGLSSKKRKNFRRFIHEVCNPEKDDYDDDDTDATDGDLQKVTIQIKEQLDDLTESIYEERREKERRSFDAKDGGSDEDGDDGDDTRRRGGAVTRRMFEVEIGKIQDDMSDVIEQQNLMAERFQKDMKKVMGLLEQIAFSSLGRPSQEPVIWPLSPSTPLVPSRSQIEVDAGVHPADPMRHVYNTASRPPTGRVAYDSNLMIQRPAIMDFGEPEVAAAFSSVSIGSRAQVPAILPQSIHSTGEWVANTQAHPPTADNAWDDLDNKRRKDIKDLREKLSQQQKIASRKSKKLGRRRSQSVTSDDEISRRHEQLDSRTQNEDNDTVVTDSSVIAELNTRSHTPDSQNPQV